MWSLLLPASAVVASLAVLASSFHRLDAELASLRLALRRARAAAVASDDLEHAATRVAEQATAMENAVHARRHRRRDRRRSPHR